MRGFPAPSHQLTFASEILATPIEGLEKHYDDPAFEVVSKLFKALAGKKVTTPGNYQSCVVPFCRARTDQS